ncbi:MAG: Asp-tRNA(Asn)/Glu-tRNA(Gln) amidotransferase subunit GatB, partial [Polyangia bacterium]
MKLEPVIGLEVHVQLSTRSKAFTSASAEFGGAPNTHTDPYTLALPGTLPVLSRGAVELAMRLGIAVESEITRRGRFARKHYFYPDLPKGYQISQLDEPLCKGGRVEFLLDGQVRRVALTRIHMEEDAGKSMHVAGASHSLVDYNRAGVPLVEIVSEPELRSAAEAAAYVRAIRQLVRWLGISDGNMEEGSLRCDANVSVRPVGQTQLGTKAELKNMNSFKHVEAAIEYEIARQSDLVARGERVVQETRLWNADKGTSHA